MIKIYDISITDVQIIPCKPKEGLVALATITVNDCLLLESIGVYKKLKKDGIRLTYPNKIYKEFSKQLYHPTKPELAEMFKKTIYEKIKKIGLLEDE